MHFCVLVVSWQVKLGANSYASKPVAMPTCCSIDTNCKRLKKAQVSHIKPACGLHTKLTSIGPTVQLATINLKMAYSHSIRSKQPSH